MKNRATVFFSLVLTMVSVVIHAAPSLKMPVKAGEFWTMTRGYNQATHVNYGNPETQDKYALDFAQGGCDSSGKPIAYGKAVLAVAGGVVLFADTNGAYGKTVVIDHGDGYKSRSAHLGSIRVSVNQVVRQGQEIGTVGDTGNVSGSQCSSNQGTHLHFAMYHNGQAYKPDPMDGYKGIGNTNGALYYSYNFGTGQKDIDAFCKSNGSDWRVERFRASNGNLMVNACPSDGRVYYYKDMMCNIEYIDLFADTDGSGGYKICGGGSDGSEYYGDDPTKKGDFVPPPANPDPKDGKPYPIPSDSDSENFSDGSNKVGFDYMKIGSRSSDKWEYDVVWREDNIPQKKDFRIKLEKKNKKWPSKKACVQVYFSHNKYFSTKDDAPIGGRKCDKFDKGDNVESVYVEDVYLPRGDMKPERNYYFFAHITDENGKLLDVSSRTTEDEYVKVDITGLRFDTQTSVTHNAPSGVKINESFQATVTVRNLRDETKDGVEITLWFAGYAQTVNLGKMGSNSAKTHTATLVAPPVAGNFDIIALSDPNARIHETDSANNRSATTVSVVQPYDFAVTDTWLTGYILDISGSVVVKSMIANNGGDAPTDLTVTATLIAEDQTEYPFGETVISAGDFPGGEVREVSIAGRVPKWEGEYDLKTCVMAVGTTETDTTNNCRFAAGPILVDPAPTPIDPAVQYIIDSEI